MHVRRKIFALFSLLSLPVMWGALQGYQHWFVKPAGQFLASRLPQFFAADGIPAAQASVLASALVSLVIAGFCALIWPEIGFGKVWQPSRAQGLVVLGILAASAAYPILNSFVDYQTPAGHMGFIIWTITPVQEEILFRGFLYAFALRLFGFTEDSPWQEAWPALLVGAAWFALWHLSPPAIRKYGWQIVGPQLLLTFGAGLLFNWLRSWTKSIWLIIPVHAVGNFMISIM